MRAPRLLAALFGVVLLASQASAQDDRSLPERLLDVFGTSIDLTKDAALKKELRDRGLIPSTTRKVTVDRAFIDRVVGNEAYWNEVRKVRYHVGDRIWVLKDGTRPHTRAEIKAINPNGTYDVLVWDSTSNASTSNIVNLETGIPDGFDPSTVVREGAVIVKMTHAEVDRANGLVDPGHGGDYKINGLSNDGSNTGGTYTADVDLVSPSRDAELQKAVAYGDRVIDEWLRSGRLDLTIPSDPVEAAKKLKEIARAQRKIFWDIYDHTKIAGTGSTGYPIDETKLIVDGVRLIGSYKRAEAGRCSSRAQWVTAVIREAGRRIGLEARGIRSSGHSRAHLRLADATRYIVDDYYNDYDRFAPLDIVPHNFELFPDHGVAKEDAVPFANEKKRAKLLAGGLPARFFERLAAAETRAAPTRIMTADELIRAARTGGAAAIGAEFLASTTTARGPSRTPGMSNVTARRVADATTTDRASRR